MMNLKESKVAIEVSLTIEAWADNGESKDDTIFITSDTHAGLVSTIKNKVQRFVSSMYDEGYREFLPSYYSYFNVALLLINHEMWISGNLHISIEGEI